MACRPPAAMPAGGPSDRTGAPPAVTAVTSRFRPWLDHLGANDAGAAAAWMPAAAEQAACAAALSAGGDLAAERLVNPYGGQAQASGALDLVAQSEERSGGKEGVSTCRSRWWRCQSI